jgi:1-aminocyclopropane-1-carboxylate deaminase/D-cysteine desulfhydrase-like pyridoxal-dependent ACC family enzyme
MVATITEQRHAATGSWVWISADDSSHRRATYSSDVVHQVIASLSTVARARLATVPTPLEAGPTLPGGARLWVKRDDLTGLGVGGNKARKLEFLCGQAVAEGCTALVTVGAAQSNHCRMTAAAGAVLGMETHLVLSGHRVDQPVGNQLLSTLFGAHLHLTGAGESEWGLLEIAREALMDELRSDGLSPFGIPIGGSTAVGALGYVVAFIEMMRQCAARDIAPRAVVVTSSSGGTHAGLVAGRALWREMQATGDAPEFRVPDVVAVGVAKGVNAGLPDVASLAREALALADGASLPIDDRDVEIDTRWLGHDYAEPTAAGDEAIRWAARHGAWVLDRTYTGKGMSGLLGQAAEGRWGPGDDVIFVHTGGLPAVFIPGGSVSQRHE